MVIPLYLALTGAEFAHIGQKPLHTAYMACHFSPYGTGITNLPTKLPEGALLILNDRTPVSGHDPNLVCRMLLDAVQRFRCRGILLDLQHSGCEKIVQKAVTLPCPIAVTERYAKALNCPVFLSAPPLNKPLAQHIAPWKGRQIWLEAAMGFEQIVVTEKGSTITQAMQPFNQEYPFYDNKLHCRYRIETKKDRILFCLHRGRQELNNLLQDAGKLGVTLAVGLYQELGV